MLLFLFLISGISPSALSYTTQKPGLHSWCTPLLNCPLSIQSINTNPAVYSTFCALNSSPSYYYKNYYSSHSYYFLHDHYNCSLTCIVCCTHPASSLGRELIKNVILIMQLLPIVFKTSLDSLIQHISHFLYSSIKEHLCCNFYSLVGLASLLKMGHIFCDLNW